LNTALVKTNGLRKKRVYQRIKNGIRELTILLLNGFNFSALAIVAGNHQRRAWGRAWTPNDAATGRGTILTNTGTGNSPPMSGDE